MLITCFRLIHAMQAAQKQQFNLIAGIPGKVASEQVIITAKSRAIDSTRVVEIVYKSCTSNISLTRGVPLHDTIFRRQKVWFIRALARCSFKPNSKIYG